MASKHKPGDAYEDEAPKQGDPALSLAEEHALLEKIWRRPPGLRGWLTSTDHKDIARRYLVTALAFFALGGVLALLMRLQLARPENDLLGPDRYNQFFSVHGTTMMFLFAVPVMEAAALYLVPLMVGTRNVAFPRLNAFGYYCYLFAGLLLWGGLLFGIGADAGWTAYPPLAGPEFSPGKRVDFWAQTVTLTEIAALVAAVEIIVTVLKMRAPGMALNRIPLFVWAMVVMAFMVLFAMPSVAMASNMLAMDRLTNVSTQFFNPAEGGDALLWQHLFWFFGHPEVYIIFVPATGFVSAILATFSRRPIFGYPAMVLALVATGFLSFGLWVHHMFATPVPDLGQSFFTGASMLIAIPSGIQIFCWIATLWGSRPRFATPLLFALGFVMLFVMGGVTGIMVASVPIDTQVHDTFFVVAHFHYTLIGGAVFPLFGAIYYWFPKVTGRLMSERLGKLNFWLFFVGFNLTFFPMHVLGLEGMPRRVYTYVPETGWGDLNLLATVGAVVLAVGVLAFAANVLVSLRRGEVAGPDPWGGETLEWATDSPPPPYNFLCPPTVRHRAPLWVGWDASPVVTGLATDHHEVLATTVLDAAPEHRYALPGHSLLPLLLALVAGGSILGVIFHPWAFPVGFVLGTVVLVFWFREGTKSPGVPEEAATEAGPLEGPSKTAPLPEHVHHETVRDT